MLISVHFKTKEKMLFASVIANMAAVFQFLLLNAITGMVVSILNVIRCIVFYQYKKKDNKPSLLILIVFEIITVITGIVTWEGYFSLMPIVGTMIYTYGLWQDDVRVIIITSGIVGLCWLSYDMVAKALIDALQKASQTISSIIAFVRIKR